jgi:hypothetical protein
MARPEPDVARRYYHESESIALLAFEIDWRCRMLVKTARIGCMTDPKRNETVGAKEKMRETGRICF